MTFQKNTLRIAGVILVVSLGIIGYLLYDAQSNLDYPPSVGQCPDYFTINENNHCVNSMGLETSCGEIPDFSTGDFTGNDGAKNKCKWAKECNLTWDGITNVALC